MALIDESKFQGSGMVKELEESAIGLILQNLQQDQYQYPEKSFIREVVSNCVDSNAEKQVARDILTGKCQVSDHYADKESDLTKDSKFDHSYYNLDFLSDDDTITIVYMNRLDNRDRIIIKDNGVGLGGSRLKGYFKPAYSTKRLNKKSLGKFGIGAKAGLSTGVESYQITSRHNGREYKFDIYNDRYYSTTPKFSDSGENPHEVWKAKRYNQDNTIEEFDNIVHYTETSKPNCLIVKMDVKNPIRNKSKYLDAVKSQLTYFDNIKFIEKKDYDSDYRLEHTVKSSIIYQDNSIIIPESGHYSAPHLVLNNVNYGVIDFGEMEMDTKRGNVGIIGDPSEIDVNQSRETVRYTEKTRDAIKKYLENSINIAQTQLNVEFSGLGSDLLGWIHACKQVRTKRHNSDTIFSRLSGLADMSKISLDFKCGDLDLQYTAKNFNEVFAGFKVNKISITRLEGVYKTNTTEVRDWSDFSADNLMYREDSADRVTAIKCGYISEEILPNIGDSLYMITPAPINEQNMDLDLEYMEQLKDVILGCPRGINYSDVDVPKDFYDTYYEKQKVHEEKEEERKVEEALTAKDIRKREGKFLYYNFRISTYSDCAGGYCDKDMSYREGNISKCKMELEIESVDEKFTKDNTIYGTSEDIPLLQSLLHMSNSLEKPKYTREKYIVGSKGNIKFIVVSKENVKFIDSHATHVKKALQTFINGKLEVMGKIRDFNTARLLHEKIRHTDYEFLQLFKDVDLDAYTAFNRLLSFVSENGFRHMYSPNVPGIDQITSYLDKVTELQLFVTENFDDKDAIAEKSKSLFNNAGIEDCSAMDMEVYATFKALEDYVLNLKPMFSVYSVAYNSDYSKVGEVLDISAIKEYIAYKNVPNFSKLQQERYTEFRVSTNN